MGLVLSVSETTQKKANGSYRTAWLMPVLHVLSGLHRDATVAIVLLVESGIQMVDNHTEVALQGVVIDWTLPVAVNTVVYVSNGCFDCPVRYVRGRILDDLANDL